jgi:hypothetical protein
MAELACATSHIAIDINIKTILITVTVLLFSWNFRTLQYEFKVIGLAHLLHKKKLFV